MQAEYRKEYMDTYLWVLHEERPEKEYEEKMLLYNQGRICPEFSMEQEDDRQYYRYKVSGKKSLYSAFETLPVREQQVKSILTELIKILMRGKDYLLDVNDYLLEPRYIFVILPEFRVELCYVPGYGTDLKKQLENLMEYLLNRVDYDDKTAVELLYDCYMLCMKEAGAEEILTRLAYDVEQIPEEIVSAPMEKRKEILDEKEGQEYRKYDMGAKLWSYGAETEVQNYGLSTGERNYRNKQRNISNTDSPELVAEQPVSYFAKFTERFFHRKKKESLLLRESKEEYGKERGGRYDDEYRNEYKRKYGSRYEGNYGNKHGSKYESNYGKSNENRYGNKQENRQEEETQTVLLSVKKEPVAPRLLSERTGELIPLSKFPFCFGSRPEYADYVMEQEGVSRMHSCIRKKGDDFYLSDLNSTNGTFLNGSEILPGTERLLASQDRIRIASEEFIFTYPKL